MSRCCAGLLLVGLTACEPNFTGTYEGPTEVVVSCEGESSVTSTSTASFTISDVDDLLVADADGCIGLPASVKGSRATLLSYPCGPYYRPLSSDVVITGGSFDLAGSDLKVVMSGRESRGSGSCPFVTTGTLHRIVTTGAQ